MPGGGPRELILPSPPAKPPDSRAELPALLVASSDPAWLELHRTSDRGIRYYLGAPTGSRLTHTFNCLLETHAGTQLGKLVPCPATRLALKGAELWRAVQLGSTHYWPLQLTRQEDHAAPLVRPLLSGDLDGHEVLLQVLFRRVLDWEFGFFSANPAYFIEKADRGVRKILERRLAQPAYHVEIRAAVLGPESKRVWDVVQAWLYSWTSLQGKPWWSLRLVDGRRRDRFVRAFRDHDIWRFAGKRVRRDLSGTELARVLPIPWKDRHVGISYVGAPSSGVPAELAACPRRGRTSWSVERATSSSDSLGNGTTSPSLGGPRPASRASRSTSFSSSSRSDRTLASS